MSDDDTDLREAFRTLKDDDRAQAPSFGRVRARAEGALRTRTRRRLVGLAVGSVALVVLLALVVRSPASSEVWVTLTRPDEPLGFLARSPSAPVTSSTRLHELERSW